VNVMVMMSDNEYDEEKHVLIYLDNDYYDSDDVAKENL